jgi:hypothetical protein
VLQAGEVDDEDNMGKASQVRKKGGPQQPACKAGKLATARPGEALDEALRLADAAEPGSTCLKGSGDAASPGHDRRAGVKAGTCESRAFGLHGGTVGKNGRVQSPTTVAISGQSLPGSRAAREALLFGAGMKHSKGRQQPMQKQLEQGAVWTPGKASLPIEGDNGDVGGQRVLSGTKPSKKKRQKLRRMMMEQAQATQAHGCAPG